MKKLLLFVCCTALLASTNSHGATEVAIWAAAGTGVGALQQSYGSVNPKDVITHVCLQFWTPTSSGGVTKSGDNPSSFVTWAHQNGIKVLLTVANNASWDWNLASSAFGNANGFATALINEANAYQMDGIDLDLEGYGVSLNQSRTQFSSFITNLSGKLKASTTNCKILTVCTTGDAPDPAGDNVPNSDWWKDWVGKVDYIHSMLYAEGGDAGCEGSSPDVVGDDQYYYSTQQSIGTSAGYAASQISMCIPSFNTENAAGWQSNWSTHFDQLLKIGASVAIWDLKLSDPNWTSSALWTKLKQFRTVSSNFTLTITKTAGGNVTTNPAGTSFAPNTQVTLTAVPSSGYKFTGWSGAVTGTQTTATLTMNGNKSVTATFTSNNVGTSFDMLASGAWESFKDSFGSTITMTKSTTSVSANWAMVKNPTNDYSYVGIDGSAANGSFAGLTTIVLTYTSSKPLLISLTDPALTETGDDYQHSLPAATTASTVTLTTTDFAQPSGPTVTSPLKLDSIVSIAFSPDYDATTAGSGTFSITQLKVNGTTLSAGTAIKNHPKFFSSSQSPLIKSVSDGLEISNLYNTRLITVYDAAGRAIASCAPAQTGMTGVRIPLHTAEGVVFVRCTGLDGKASFQRIIR
jgi:uncharacterized repeat protein (TIGR02543 family)